MSSALFSFLRERFPIGAHAFMVAVFAFANVALVADLGAPEPFEPLRFAAAWLIALSYFFRLRCFDEIKDHAFDLEHNPERPLARGLVTEAQLKRWIAVAAVFELALAFWLFDTRGLAIHAAAQAYSLLMYREFFIGRWIRPHLTTYAVAHTISAAFLGGSIGFLYARALPVEVGSRALVMLLFNWCLFNLFEFARKTWAPDEERANVDSYSLIFGVPGAVLLSLSQVGIGIFLTTLHPRALEAGWPWLLQASLAALPLATGVVFITRRDPGSAAIFRNTVSAYLVLFYAALSSGHATRALFTEDSDARTSELDTGLRAP